MLDIYKHEIVLKSILRDIYKDNDLNTKLGFKGGTCLYFFYNLPRFSTDLDFNKLNTFKPIKITSILKQYINLEEYHKRTQTYFWLGSYEKGKQKIKVEISYRKFPDEYESQNFYGITISTMKKEFMLAHKLCAITDRKFIQNRDLFDAWFMMKNQFEINDNIIRIRTKKDTKDYLDDLIKLIKNDLNKNKILDGLGEVLDRKKKDWVKDHLIEELLFELEIRKNRYM